MAFHSLISNKLRSTLSVIGITIGIFSIITVFTAVDSLEMNIKNSLQSLGKNVIYIDKWQWVGGGNDYPWWKYVNRPDARYSEVKSIKDQPVSQLIDAVAFTSSTNTTVRAGDKFLENVKIDGYSYEFSKIENLEITEGRFFNEFEDNNARNVAILGHNVATGLFDTDKGLVGKSINLFGKRVEIIGVFKNQGDNIINIDFDDNVVVPVRFLQYISNNESNANIIIKAKDNVGSDAIYEELRGSMRSIRRLKPQQEDNFSLNKISFLSETITELFGTINMFGLIIGLFSLLVGGFGVANIMFVSVKERTNIIGIQKALGAKNEFILFHFLTESVVLSLLGGLVGILLTWGISGLLNTVLASGTSTFRMVLTMGNVFQGLLFASAIGLLAGMIPAYRASRLVPVEAIRSK
ncbi:MAG: ABC transporter permease [Bacteroidetes bacterium]|nr:ABC transporter permease [Bacteroidota bacterium]